MSHNFKSPASIDPRERRADRAVNLMATHIKDQAMLDNLLADASPITRAAMIDRLVPYLSFVPRECAPAVDTADA